MLNIALYGHAAFKRQLATSFLEHSVRRFPLTSPSSDTASNSDHPNSAAPCAESSVAASSSCDAGPPLLAPLAIHLDLLPAAHAQDSANWIQTDRPLAGPELSKLARFQTNLIGLRSLLDCGGPFMIGPTQQLQGRRAFSTESTIDIFDRALKRRQRDRAARLQRTDDPVLEAAAEGLVDRMDDCKRSFPVAAVINGAGENVIRRLAGGRGGVKEVVLIDSSAEMLDRTRRLEAQHRAAGDTPSWPHITYVQAEEDRLPLATHSVDVILCPLGLHWINDLPGALIQCRKALVPDGLLLGAMLGADSLQELRITCTLAEQEMEGGVASRISPLARVRDAGNLLTRAALAIPSVDVDDVVIQYSHPARLIAHLRAMGETNASKGPQRAIRRSTAARTVEKYAEMFGSEDGAFPATFQIVYLTGWSPHASQQGPSQRGSASASFEDLEKAINAMEERT